jgi:hypothetical protein
MSRSVTYTGCRHQSALRIYLLVSAPPVQLPGRLAAFAYLAHFWQWTASGRLAAPDTRTVRPPTFNKIRRAGRPGSRRIKGRAGAIQTVAASAGLSALLNSGPG